MELENRRIALLVENLFEDLELFYPYYRMQEAGAEVTILGSGKGTYRGKKGLTVTEDARVAEVDAADFDAVIIPGGYAPDHMRRHPPMVNFVRELDNSGKTVAFICHAGWLAISADILRGRRATSFHAIRDDMRNAGANWIDEPVVTDGNLISSRVPDDLPAFCRTIIEALSGE